MIKLYKSYILKEINEIKEKDIDILKAISIFKVFYIAPISCNIAEWYASGKLFMVFYYKTELSKEIIMYHKLNYGSLMYGLSEILNRGIKHTYYIEEKIIKYSIELIDNLGRPTISQDFNQDFELTEYRVYQYNDAGEEVGIKIFYPNSWTIHEEDSIM